MSNRVDPTYVSVDIGNITIVADVTAEQSTTIPDWIISHPDLSDRAVRLWAYLRGAVRGTFHLSGGSHVALSSILKTGSRSTREAIYQLRDAGALAIQPMFKDGKQMPNAYFLWPAIPDGSALIASKNGVAVFCHGGSIFPPVSTIITNNTNNTGNEAADVIEAVPAKRSRLTYPNEFNELWKVYPRKLNKGGAYKMYAKLVREGSTPADLISATEAYAKTRKGEAEQYTMHAATFFGANDRWRDFLPEPVPEVDKVSARVYDQWDELACYTDPRTGAPVDQNPSIAGYIRPSGPENTFLGADNTPYVLDAQGRRQRPDYWN